MHCQKGVSNAIICLLIHTLLFSLSALPMEAGEADRRRKQYAAGWKEPHSQRDGGVAPRRERWTSKRGWWVQERPVGFLLAATQGLWQGSREKREATQQWWKWRWEQVSQGSCLPNTGCFDNVASNHQAKIYGKAFYLLDKNPAVLYSYQVTYSTKMGIKMPVTKWSAKPWTQLELSVQSPVISGSTTNLYVYFVRYMDSCNYKHLNIVTAEPLILAGKVLSSHWVYLTKQTNGTFCRKQKLWLLWLQTLQHLSDLLPVGGEDCSGQLQLLNNKTGKIWCKCPLD